MGLVVKVLLEFDNDWILLKPLTVQGYEYFKEGRVIEALPFLIQEWSENAPINYKTCYRLKPKVVRRIKEKLLKEVAWLLQVDSRELVLVIKAFLKGHPTTDDELSRKLLPYIEKAVALVDHKGNIITWPEPGGILEQPLDWFLILRAYKVAFVEYLAEQNRTGR